jgi:hypothetical protein
VSTGRKSAKTTLNGFRAWLRKHLTEDTPRGDLARDAERDTDFPRTFLGAKEAKAYLLRRNASTYKASVIRKNGDA